jgi:hypothetical protein
MFFSPRRMFGGFLLLLISFCGVQDAHAFPAFARKYGLRCSACHVAWPVLNDFGWRFKDNGYQLMNDRDAPIWQNPSYWPVAFRVTPNWHRESSNKVAIDQAGGAEQQITVHGFDNSGLDILSGGTLDKNVSFLFVPSADETGAFHIESMWVRFDNLFHSPWFNVRMGKFELDNFLSEKRSLGLSGNGGSYQNYHFEPIGDGNFAAGIGDNQLGLEWMGHSLNDHTRISAALISSSGGSPDLVNANAYSGFFAASQAFDAGGLGLQRVGGFAFIGEAPTNYLSTGGAPLLGIGNKGFYRAGAWGDFYLSKLDVALWYQHASDSVYLGTSTAAGTPLPTGAKAPVWNGYIIEPHLTLDPQFIIFERNEYVRMSQQALPGTPGNLGDIDAYTFGYRWYPIMNSRAGLAFHNEYSWVRQRGTSPTTGTDLTSSSLFFGLDFDF